MSRKLLAIGMGRWLKENRIRAEMTQADVAKKIGYTTPQFISNWERGISMPPLSVYARLVRIYKADRPEAIARYQAVKMMPVESRVQELKRRLG